MTWRHLGHFRIGFISSGFPQMFGGKGDIGTTREHLFRQEMQTQGLNLPEGYVTYGAMAVYGVASELEDHTRSVLDATQALLLHREGCPTAILCWRDETAMVVMGTCEEQGLRIPEHIFVVGFSNISSAKFADPPLSTVISPWKGMGRRAIREVIQRMSESSIPTRPPGWSLRALWLENQQAQFPLESHDFYLHQSYQTDDSIHHFDYHLD